MNTEPYLAIATTVPTPSTQQTEGQRVQGLLNVAHQRFQSASDYESKRRLQALSDLRFRAGEQWDQWVMDERRRLGRPCPVFNRIPQFLKQVVNDQRQNRPGVQINPVGSGADQDTAEIFEGMIRHINSQSQADVAMDTSFENMVTMGFGFWRVITRYVEPRTEFNDLELAIEWIPDPFSVYFDPSAMQADFSDASWAFIVQDMTRAEFRARWPKADIASLDAFTGTGDATTRLLWLPDGNVRVAEYFYVEMGERTLCKLASGIEMYLEDVQEGQIVMSRRDVPARIVHHAIISGAQILEEDIWEGSSIPIIPVLGDELRVDGDRQFIGMVRYSYDAQRMYNYASAALIEAVALMPKAQYIVEATQIEGFEKEWQESSNRPVVALRYHAKSLFGQALPAPQRVTGSVDIQPILATIQQNDNNMKAIFGIYDASLGSRGPQESGRAILARQRESDVANFNYVDNLSRAIRHCGRILVDLIPKIYDRPGRVVHILKPDGTSKPVTLNQPYQEQGGKMNPLGMADLQKIEEAQQWDAALIKFYDLRVGQYDVIPSSGPSYNTMRQEESAAKMALVAAHPEIMAVAGDLIVKDMDWPGAREMAARLKKALPPNLQEPEEGQKQIPPQVQASLEQMQTMIQDMTKIINTQQQQIDGRTAELESRERIALEGNATQLFLEQMRQGHTAAMTQMQQEHAASLAVFQAGVEAIQQRLELLHANQPVATSGGSSQVVQ